MAARAGVFRQIATGAHFLQIPDSERRWRGHLAFPNLEDHKIAVARRESLGPPSGFRFPHIQLLLIGSTTDRDRELKVTRCDRLALRVKDGDLRLAVRIDEEFDELIAESEELSALRAGGQPMRSEGRDSEGGDKQVQYWFHD